MKLPFHLGEWLWTRPPGKSGRARALLVPLTLSHRPEIGEELSLPAPGLQILRNRDTLPAASSPRANSELPLS